MKKFNLSVLCLFMMFCIQTAAQTAQETWTYQGHTYTQKGTLTANQYDRNAFRIGKCADRSENIISSGRIESGRRLVENQAFRAHRKHTRDRNPAFLAA